MSRSAKRRSVPAAVEDRSDAGQPQRLQKVLAAAGVASRRECEELIVQGRVEIDRKVVTELGVRVDPESAEIRVDGAVVKAARQKYYAVHKPQGVVSTNRDPSGRPRVVDLVGGDARLFAVGRLDLNSEGLILVTNDGELANALTHPRYGIAKTYQVTVAGHPKGPELAKLRKGVRLAEGLARVDDLRIRKRLAKATVLEMVLREGRNREIRRVLARVGYKVLRLKRVAVGPIRLGDLPPGAVRELTRDEVSQLRRAARRGASGSKSGGRRPSGAGSPTTRSRGARSGRPGTVIGESKAASGSTGSGGGSQRKPRRSESRSPGKKQDRRPKRGR